MRTLETTLQASKTEISKLEEQNKARTNELTKAREEIDEKIQTANKVHKTMLQKNRHFIEGDSESSLRSFNQLPTEIYVKCDWLHP